MRRGRRAAGLLAVVAGAAAAAVAVGVTRSGGSASAFPDAGSGAAAWRGLVARRPPVALPPRAIVLLRTPSLAQRVAAAGGAATAARERSWTAAARAAQDAVVARLAAGGLRLRPELRFARVLDGFSARVDPAAAARIERDPDVAAVYPVRVAYPAATGTVAGIGAHRLPSPPAGLDGAGVTIALLDTAVARALPFLHGAVLPQVDVVGGGGRPALEAHGTEVAGLLVGSGGPEGIAGAAPGARVLPIRVAGRQQAPGGAAVFARSDQILAGLERAVDPDGDGDAHDAVRVALVPLAEPFGGFADGPLSRAAAGAARLGTLVVAPAGNDGPAAGGDLSGPGGAAAALTVGAADARVRATLARVRLRAGETAYAGTVALANDALPAGRIEARVALRPAPARAVLLAAGAAPAETVRLAAAAGAVAVLLDTGSRTLAAGGLGLDSAAALPALSLPGATARPLRRRLERGGAVTLSLAPAAPAPHAASVAGFSSTGPALDGRPKPDLVAPGVALATAPPGRGRWATVNGTSAAAAAAAGAAAVVAQAHPGLGADELHGLLTGTADPDGAPVAAAGAGTLDEAAAAAGRLAAVPATLALDRSGAGTFELANVSPRRLELGLSGPGCRLAPARFALAPGARARVRVRGCPRGDGVLAARGPDGTGIRVPWARRPAPAQAPLLGRVSLSKHVFAAADVAPAVLSVDAGRVRRTALGPSIRTLARLDVELWQGGRRLGLLARLRDVLPGRYTFGITGRDAAERPLPAGSYAIRVVAVPVGGGSPAARKLRFALR